MCDELRVTTTE